MDQSSSPNRDVLVLGAGFAGLATATYLAKAGHRVRVLERHDTLGGRARKFQAEGFTFDMGPSWYWMPDVFERYFADFGADVNEEMNLVRLDPSYTVWFDDGPLQIPAGLNALATVLTDSRKRVRTPIGFSASSFFPVSSLVVPRRDPIGMPSNVVALTRAKMCSLQSRK